MFTFDWLLFRFIKTFIKTNSILTVNVKWEDTPPHWCLGRRAIYRILMRIIIWLTMYLTMGHGNRAVICRQLLESHLGVLVLVARFYRGDGRNWGGHILWYEPANKQIMRTNSWQTNKLWERENSQNENRCGHPTASDAGLTSGSEEEKSLTMRTIKCQVYNKKWRNSRSLFDLDWRCNRRGGERWRKRQSRQRCQWSTQHTWQWESGNGTEKPNM